MKTTSGCGTANPRARKQRTHLWRLLAFLAVLFVLPGTVGAQDWFRTGTGLGVAKPRVAVADFVSRSANTPPLATLFSEVLRNDLEYSGILELASSSFNPTQPPSAPA